MAKYVEDCANYEKTGDWKTTLFRWLATQGVSTVLLVAILASMAYISDYAMKIAIPAHLKQIQDGYIAHAETHSREVKQITEAFDAMQKQRTEAFTASLKSLTDTFEREMEIVRDRNPKKPGDG